MSLDCPMVNKDDIDPAIAIQNLYQLGWIRGVLGAEKLMYTPAFDSRLFMMSLGHDINGHQTYAEKYPDLYEEFARTLGYSTEGAEGFKAFNGEKIPYNEFVELAKKALSPEALYNIDIYPGENFSNKNTVIPELLAENCPPELLPRR